MISCEPTAIGRLPSGVVPTDLPSTNTSAHGVELIDSDPDGIGTFGVATLPALTCTVSGILTSNCSLDKTRSCEVTGVRHDTGNKLGFLKAVIYFALRRPDLAEPLREYLRSVTP